MMYGMGFGSIFWLLTIGLIVWGIITISNNNRRNQSPQLSESGETALEILKRRYASGEISHEEFERMKKELNN